MAERRWKEEKRYVCGHGGNDRGCTDAGDRTPILQRSDGQCQEPSGARIRDEYPEKVPGDDAGYRPGHPPHLASGIARQQPDHENNNGKNGP